MEIIDFLDENYTFKLKWTKQCMKAPESLWYLIPQNIFNRMGGLQVLLQYNYNETKLSKFSQQPNYALSTIFLPAKLLFGMMNI